MTYTYFAIEAASICNACISQLIQYFCMPSSYCYCCFCTDQLCSGVRQKPGSKNSSGHQFRRHAMHHVWCQQTWIASCQSTDHTQRCRLLLASKRTFLITFSLMQNIHMAGDRRHVATGCTALVPIMNVVKERIRPGHWLAPMLRAAFSAFTLLVC